MFTRDDDPFNHGAFSGSISSTMKKNCRFGVTLLESLISFSVFSMIILVVLQILLILSNIDTTPLVTQHDIGYLQLKQRLVLGKVSEISEDRLCVFFDEKEFCFQLIQGKLIKTPGTEIFMRDLIFARFERDEHCIRLMVKSEGKMWDECIIYE